MHSSLDLNDIRAFTVVVETGSMSAAAKALGLPTSTISRSIARLEKHLSVLLIRRGQHGVTLTDAGKEFLPSCVQAMRLLQDGQAALTEQTVHPEGTVRIACPVTMARELLAPLVPRFVELYPGLKVDIVPYTPGWNIVPDDSTDVFFHVWPIPTLTGVTSVFPSTRRGIYTSKRYADRFGLPETPEDLARFDCIGSRGVPAFAKWNLKSDSRTVSLELDFRTMAADPATIRAMLLEDLGITLLPVWMALQPGTREAIVRILPAWEPSPVPLLGTCHRAEPLIPKVRLCLEFLKSFIGTELDPRMPGPASADCFVPAPADCFV